MSLRTLLGARAPLFSEVAEAAHVVELESFFLFPSSLAELPLSPLDATFDTDRGARDGVRPPRGRGRRSSPQGRRAPASQATRERGPTAQPSPRCSRSERSTSGSWPPACAPPPRSSSRATSRARRIASPASSATGPTRSVPVSRSTRFAALAVADRIGGDHPPPDEAQSRFREAIEDGVLKVMSKMGIYPVPRASLKSGEVRPLAAPGGTVEEHPIGGTTHRGKTAHKVILSEGPVHRLGGVEGPDGPNHWTMPQSAQATTEIPAISRQVVAVKLCGRSTREAHLPSIHGAHPVRRV